MGLTLHVVGLHLTYKQAQVKQTVGKVMDDKLLRKSCRVLKLVDKFNTPSSSDDLKP